MGVLYLHVSLLPASTSLTFAALAHLLLSGNHPLYFPPSPCTCVYLEAPRMLLKVWEGRKS